MARILLCRRMGRPWAFLDLSALREVSAREVLGVVSGGLGWTEMGFGLGLGWRRGRRGLEKVIRVCGA